MGTNRSILTLFHHQRLVMVAIYISRLRSAGVIVEDVANASRDRPPTLKALQREMLAGLVATTQASGLARKEDLKGVKQLTQWATFAKRNAAAAYCGVLYRHGLLPASTWEAARAPGAKPRSLTATRADAALTAAALIGAGVDAVPTELQAEWMARLPERAVNQLQRAGRAAAGLSEAPLGAADTLAVLQVIKAAVELALALATPHQPRGTKKSLEELSATGNGRRPLRACSSNGTTPAPFAPPRSPRPRSRRTTRAASASSSRRSTPTSSRSASRRPPTPRAAPTPPRRRHGPTRCRLGSPPPASCALSPRLRPLPRALPRLLPRLLPRRRRAPAAPTPSSACASKARRRPPATCLPRRLVPPACRPLRPCWRSRPST